MLTEPTYMNIQSTIDIQSLIIIKIIAIIKAITKITRTTATTTIIIIITIIINHVNPHQMPDSHACH